MDGVATIPKLVRVELYEVESPSSSVADLTLVKALHVGLRKILVPGQKLQATRHQVHLEMDYISFWPKFHVMKNRQRPVSKDTTVFLWHQETSLYTQSRDVVLIVLPIRGF